MKQRKWLRILGIFLAVIVLFITVINLIEPAKNVEYNPFVVKNGSLPMIAAHRGGGDNNPENTMLAFREAVNTIGVDILESDLYLTKDGYLVFNHDAYIDETCNVNGDLSLEEVKALCQKEENRHYIRDMTLAQLQQYNFGYYFENSSGQRVYRNVEDPAATGLQIATADILFSEFYVNHPDLLFIVEIKDSGERGLQACAALDSILEQYPQYQNRIVIGTFHDEVEAELRESYPYLLTGASTGSAAKFILTQYLGVNLFEHSSFSCLQIPTSYDLGITIPLNKQTIIRRAHRRNIAVQYWTINDADEMRQLIELGCDCIMTDDPMLLKSILNEYQ